MLAQPRALTTALVVLACLYLAVLFKSQSDQEFSLADLRNTFYHYTGNLSLFSWDSKNTTSPASAHVTLPTGSATIPAALSTVTAATTPPDSSSLADPVEDTPSVESTIELPNLQSLCRETKWTPNLWLHCHSYSGENGTAIAGGLNNARNRIQTCVRWAIDAGAGLILPTVTLRGVVPNQLVGGDETCLDIWWDLDHLDKAIKANCPQLELRAACPTGQNNTAVAIPPPEEPSIPPLTPAGRQYKDARFSKGLFRQNVILPTLQSYNISSSDLASNITVIEYGDAYIGWDYRVSDELNTIRKELHLAIRFRKQLLDIGERIRNSSQLHGGEYIGVHLRGEADWPADWGNADQQMALYSEQIAKIRGVQGNVSAVFVSSGDQAVIQRFREMLEPLNYTVHDKWTILKALQDPEDLAVVDSIDFDSKGIVDYAVLSRAEFFMGVFMSTMSKYVAYTRTTDIANFFDDFIFANSVKDGGNWRTFSDAFSMHGNNYTSILVTNGLDLSDSFP